MNATLRLVLAFTLAALAGLGRGLIRVFGAASPVQVAHAYGDPNVIGSFCFVVPADAALETSPTISELLLLGCPDDLGVQLALEYVGFSAVTLPVDAANNINVDIEFYDDSAASATDLTSAFAMDDDATARVMTTVFVGYQVLDPGDTINAEFDVTTPTTASEGAGFVVLGKVLTKSSA